MGKNKLKGKNMDQPKILISAEADQRLDQMLREVNQNFSSGRVKKTQLSSWILMTFFEKSFAKQIKRIQSAHFDRIAHLKSLVKKLESAEGESADLELSRLLSPLKGRDRKKRTAKESTPTAEIKTEGKT